MKCKCNNCDFIGNEEDLSLFETKGDGTETITAEETADHKIIRSEPIPENPFYFKGCPNCKTDGYLIDIDEAAEVTSSGNKHTAGEWHAKEGQIYPIETGKTLALIPYFDEENEEEKANAKLIAASPHLLSNLITIRDILESWNTDGKYKNLIEHANTAINHATQ